MSQQSTETEIALINQSIDNFKNLFKQNADNFERLTQISVNLEKLLAVQEEKIKQTIELNINNEKLIENRRLESVQRNEELYKTINGVKTDLTKSIVDIKEELINILNKNNEELKLSLTDANKRITILEQWKWRFTGIAVAVGSIITVAVQFAFEYLATFGHHK